MAKIIQIASYHVRGVLCLDDEGNMYKFEQELEYSEDRQTAKYVDKWTKLPKIPN